MNTLDADTNKPSAPDTQKMARDGHFVKSGFWPKVPATLGKVPFTEDAVVAFYCATDRGTPAYFIVP